MYVTSHKRPFIPSVGGIGLLCNVKAEGRVCFVKRLQRSPTGKLIPLDGSVIFCEKFVVRGREFSCFYRVINSYNKTVH